MTRSPFGDCRDRGDHNRHTANKAAGTDLVRSLAERAGATITEPDGSHVIMVSQPDAVADFILTVARAIDRAPATVAG